MTGGMREAGGAFVVLAFGSAAIDVVLAFGSAAIDVVPAFRPAVIRRSSGH